MNTFLATLSPMLVMFLCIVIGFVLRKTKVTPENTATVLSKLEINVFMPAVILRTFLNYCTVESLTAQYTVVIYGAVAVALSAAMSIFLCKIFTKDRDERKIYRYAMLFANFGFLGNAIVPAVMGDEMMYPYMLFTIPMNIVLYLWAFNSLIPEGKGKGKSGLKSLINPTCIFMVVGIALGLLGVGKLLPSFFSTTLGNLASCMAPVSMLLTGFVIGGYCFGDLLKNKMVYLATFLRLIVLPAIIIGVLWLLGSDKNTMLMAFFAYSTALGLNTVIVPAAYGGDTHTGAAMAMISHVACVITIPILYALLTQIL